MTPDKRKRGTMYDRGDWSTRRNRTSERGNGATNLASSPAVRFQPNRDTKAPTSIRSVLLPRHSLRSDKTFRHCRKRSRGSVFLRCFNHRCLESKRSYLRRNAIRFRMLGRYIFYFLLLCRHWPILIISFSSFWSFPRPSGKSIQYFFSFFVFFAFSFAPSPPPFAVTNVSIGSLVIVPDYESRSWFRNLGTSSRPAWILRNILSQWRVVQCLRKMRFRWR